LYEMMSQGSRQICTEAFQHSGLKRNCRVTECPFAGINESDELGVGDRSLAFEK